MKEWRGAITTCKHNKKQQTSKELFIIKSSFTSLLHLLYTFFTGNVKGRTIKL